MQANQCRGPGRDGRSAVAALLAVLIVTVGASSAALGAPPPEQPAWMRAMPASTSFVVRLEPGRLGAVSEAIAKRAGIPNDERILAADHPVSALVGAFLTDSVDAAMRGDSSLLAGLSFEHLDESRPLVVGVDVRPVRAVRTRLRLGLPPIDADRLGSVRRVRTVVPSSDPEALVDEFEELCRKGRAEYVCSDQMEWRATDGAVWIDDRRVRRFVRGTREEGASEEDGLDRWSHDTDFFEPRTPAVRAFGGADTSVAVYARADVLRRLRLAGNSEYFGYLADWLREDETEDRPYRILALRHQIAEAMTLVAAGSPSTREIRDMTVLVDSDDDGNLRADAVQSFTSYGARIAQAATVDVELPSFGMPRPIASGAVRFDVAAALDAAEQPSWMEHRVAGRTFRAQAKLLVESSDGVAPAAALLTQPVSTGKAVRSMLEAADLPRIARPGPYLRIAGLSYALDVDSARLVQGGPGLRGGIALALTEAEAAGTYLNLVDFAQSALGVPIRTNTRESGPYTMLELRVDSDRSFSPGETSRATPLRGQLHLDRLLAKIEVLDPELGMGTETRRLMRFLDGLEFGLETGAAGRAISVRSGSIPAPEVDLGTNGTKLGMPPAQPSCFREAVAASMRLYITEIAELGEASETPRRRPPRSSLPGREGEERRPPNVELSEKTRKAIASVVESLDELRTSCRDAGGRWARRVRRIRSYWQRVRKGEAPTHPQVEFVEEASDD